MIHSIVGQNERWAQLAALQPPPAALSGQGGGLGFSNSGTAVADPSVVQAISGDASSPLSSNMNFMLMMFGSGSSTSGAGITTGASSGSGTSSATDTAGAPGDPSDTQDMANFGPMLAELQSLMSGMSGNSSSAANTSPATTAALSNATTSNSSAGSASQSQAGAGPIVASLGGGQAPPPPSGEASGTQSTKGTGSDDITNTGTTVASAEPALQSNLNGTSGAAASWTQQFAVSAYTSGEISGLNSATTSALQSITV